MEKLLLIGGGGHCNSIIDSLMSQSHRYEQIGIIDREERLGQYVHGIPVIGVDDDLPVLYEQGYNNAFISLGSVGNPINRIQIYRKIKKIGYKIPNIIDETAIVSKNTKIGDGVFIGKRAIVNIGVSVGDNTIINSGAIIEHDCEIGSFVHLAPGCIVCGGDKVGDNTHIGANATIIQGIEIGKNTIIGAGTVVIKDIKSECTIIGNPGRKLR